jgi:hypothetical protein
MLRLSIFQERSPTKLCFCYELLSLTPSIFVVWRLFRPLGTYIEQVLHAINIIGHALSLSLSLAPQPSLGLGLLRNLLPLKMAEFLGCF